MPPTSTLSESPPRTPRPKTHLPIAIVVLVAVVALLIQMSTSLSPPATVEQITVHNDTDYDLTVDLRGSPDGAITALGEAPAGSDKTFHSVVDTGETYIFHFSYAGIDAGSITMDEDTLAENDWEMTIPSATADPLRDAGIAPHRS